MGSSTWSSSDATRNIRSLARQWFGHTAGILPVWARLSAPFALGAAWLSGRVGPLLVAPAAAALYALTYVALRQVGARVPLHRLRRVDTMLLAVAAAGGGAIGAWLGGRPSWVVAAALLAVTWYHNWWHEGMPAGSGGGALPPAPRFIAPVTGPVSAGYRSYDRSHTGVDLAVPVGTPVVAPAPGTVAHAGPLEQWGYAVLVDHGDGWSTLFAHLDRTAVRRGARVEAGALLAWSGTSGISTGPHVHMELRHRGRPVDPAPLLGGPPPLSSRSD